MYKRQCGRVVWRIVVTRTNRKVGVRHAVELKAAQNEADVCDGRGVQGRSSRVPFGTLHRHKLMPRNSNSCEVSSHRIERCLVRHFRHTRLRQGSQSAKQQGCPAGISVFPVNG